MFKDIIMKAIDGLRCGLALGLALVLSAGLALRADDKAKKEPVKEKDPAKEKEAAKEKESEKDAGEKLWIVDFDDAKAVAAKEGKAILMEFTGSDWCPPCKALKKAVFDSKVFQDEAPKHFVLLKIDSPRDKSKQTDKEIEQCKTMSKEHKIQGVPTIILADAKGKPFAKKVGYGGEEAKDYTKWLVDKADVPKKRDSFLAQAKSAQGTERAKLLGQAIGGIDNELAIEIHRDIVDEIIKLDADNKAGLKAKYDGVVQMIDLKKELATLQEEAADAAELMKKIDKVIADKKLTGEPLQEALWTKGQHQFGADREGCKKTLEASIAAAPDTERAKQIKAIVERVFKDEKKDKDTAKTEKTEKPKGEKKE